MTNLDADSVPEFAYSSSFGGDLFSIHDTKTLELDWQSDDIDPPFYGYTLYEPRVGNSSADDHRYLMALVPSESAGGFGNTLVFGIDFETKEEVWQRICIYI